MRRTQLLMAVGCIFVWLPVAAKELLAGVADALSASAHYWLYG
jgi:hypothetical protein